MNSSERPMRRVFSGASTSTGRTLQLVPITYSCGHQGEVEFFGDPSKSTYYQSLQLRLCRDCYRRSSVEEDNAQVLAGKRCVLQGTSKQVEWAAGIRNRRATAYHTILTNLKAAASLRISSKQWLREEAISNVRAVADCMTDILMGNIEWELDAGMLTSSDAKWWVEVRDLTDRDILSKVMPERNWIAGSDPDDYSSVLEVIEVERTALVADDEEDDEDFITALEKDEQKASGGSSVDSWS